MKTFMKKAVAILLVAGMACCFAGCGQNYELSTVDYREDMGNHSVESFDYNIGKGKYLNMPYRIRGHMSLPKDVENAPLAVILHGSHDNEHPDTGFYKGFSGLTEGLAKQGIAAVSLDIQPAYVWKYGERSTEKTIELYRQFRRQLDAALGGKKIFPVDMKGRVNTKQTVLVGHSCGGEAVLKLSKKEKDLAGIFLIAPSITSGVKKLRDVPMAGVQGQLDGDVSSYDIYSLFSQAKKEKLKSPLTVTFLKGANHNAFNDKLTKNDAVSGFVKQDTSGQISGEKQRAVLQTTLSDFCKSVTGDGAKNSSADAAGAGDGSGRSKDPATMYDAICPTIERIDGADVSVLRYLGEKHSLLANKVKADDIEATRKVDSYFYKNDEIPGLESCLNGERFLVLDWNKINATCAVSGEDNTKSCKNGLMMSYVPIPGAANNIPKDRISFDVLLETTDGKKATVKVPDTLFVNEIADGELTTEKIAGVKITSWSRYTPPGTVNIPLDSVGLGGKSIKKVSLRFSGSEKGSIAIWDLAGY